MITVIINLFIFINIVSSAINPEINSDSSLPLRIRDEKSQYFKSGNINGSSFLVDSTYTYMYPFSPDSVLRYKQRYVYDEQQNLVLEESLTMNAEGIWIYQTKNEYAFDNRGNLIERAFYNTDTGEVSISSREKIEYNSDNKIIIHYWYIYDETINETIKETIIKDEIKYNKHGNWIEIIRYAFNYETNDWICNKNLNG